MLQPAALTVLLLFIFMLATRIERLECKIDGGQYEEVAYGFWVGICKKQKAAVTKHKPHTW